MKVEEGIIKLVILSGLNSRDHRKSLYFFHCLRFSLTFWKGLLFLVRWQTESTSWIDPAPIHTMAKSIVFPIGE